MKKTIEIEIPSFVWEGIEEYKKASKIKKAIINGGMAIIAWEIIYFVISIIALADNKFL